MKNVIAIFDVGKTNKKLLLFDEQYKVVFEQIARFTETTDEDGFPCENLDSLIESVIDSLQEVIRNSEYNITAVNFSVTGVCNKIFFCTDIISPKPPSKFISTTEYLNPLTPASSGTVKI